SDDLAPKPLPGQVMVRAAARPEPVVIMARAADAFSQIDALARAGGAAPLIIDGNGAEMARIQAVLNHAWNPNRPLDVWEAGLNGVLGTALDQPDAAAVIDAVVHF